MNSATCLSLSGRGVRVLATYVPPRSLARSQLGMLRRHFPELSEEQVGDEAIVAPEVLLPTAPPTFRRRDPLLLGVVVTAARVRFALALGR